MKKLVITPELALTISLLEYDDAGKFIQALVDYAKGYKGIDPSDYPTRCDIALRYWLTHIDDIIITVED